MSIQFKLAYVSKETMGGSGEKWIMEGQGGWSSSSALTFHYLNIIKAQFTLITLYRAVSGGLESQMVDLGVACVMCKTNTVNLKIRKDSGFRCFRKIPVQLIELCIFLWRSQNRLDWKRPQRSSNSTCG